MATKSTKADDAYAEALKLIAACRAEGKAGTMLELSELGLTALPPEIGQLTALKVDDN